MVLCWWLLYWAIRPDESDEDRGFAAFNKQASGTLTPGVWLVKYFCYGKLFMIVHFFPQFSRIFCVKYFTFQPLEAFKSASDERNLRMKTHSLLELYFKCLMSELVQFGHSTRSILMHVELTEHPALCSSGAWLQCSSLHRSAAVSPSRELMRKQPCTRWEFSPWRRRQHVFFPFFCEILSFSPR